MPIRRRWFWLLVVLAAPCSIAPAAEKVPFQEGRFEKGELKYVNHLPVLSVEGTPEEIGRQEAALTGAVVKVLGPYPQQLMTLSGRGQQWGQCVETARSLMSHATQEHRDELRSFAAQSAISLDLLTTANTIMDLHRGGFACSSLMVEPGKSQTGGVLFGRNLDFYTLGVLDRYGLITVYRPKGKHAFATVGFPGVTGCISGMNDAGLAIAVHEVNASADGPIFNAKGMPYALAFRRILEECKTIEEAEKLLPGPSDRRSSVWPCATAKARGCWRLRRRTLSSAAAARACASIPTIFAASRSRCRRSALATCCFPGRRPSKNSAWPMSSRSSTK